MVGIRAGRALKQAAKEHDRVVGARVRSMRTSAGMSQGDLGEALGVTFQQIQKYEKGTNRISGSALIALCRVLKTTPDHLLGADSNGKVSNSATALDLLDDPAVYRALGALHALPEKRRSAVARAMLALVTAFE
ncbi:MAG: helix-turn-helix domain-containing protein [Rhizobiales bacterium]|nr:helix-turn-helix domain-containing protein [Hyphomicrobiales bacterium]